MECLPPPLRQETVSFEPGRKVGGGGKLLPIILLNETHNLQSDQQGSCKIMAAQGGTVSHYYILVNRNFFGFMSLFRHRVWFSFSFK